MSRVLVLGGTGMLGTPVARHLLEDGFDVRILSRDLIKVRELFGGDVDLAAGDIGNLKVLQRAMQDCVAVHISIGGIVDQESAEQVARLAPGLGIERIGYVSGTTVCEANAWYPMVAAKLAAERAVMSSGVAWTIFRPTWPMEQLPNFLRLGRPMVLGQLSTPYHFLAASDMGRMVSVAYRIAAAAERCLYLHGPEPVRVKDAVERYATVLEPDAGEVTVMPIWKAKLIGLVTGNRRLRSAASLMAYFEKVDEPGDPTEANDLLGAPTTTLEAWITEQIGQAA